MRAIQATDQFSSTDYPLVVKEITQVKELLSRVDNKNKSAMVISFLRFHSLKEEWLVEHPAIVKVLTSKSTSLSNLESLFDLGKDNKSFLIGLEKFIESQLLH